MKPPSLRSAAKPNRYGRKHQLPNLCRNPYSANSGKRDAAEAASHSRNEIYGSRKRECVRSWNRAVCTGDGRFMRLVWNSHHAGGVACAKRIRRKADSCFGYVSDEEYAWLRKTTSHSVPFPQRFFPIFPSAVQV